MKRNIAFLLAALLVLCLCAGCAKTDKNAPTVSLLEEADAGNSVSVSRSTATDASAPGSPTDAGKTATPSDAGKTATPTDAGKTATPTDAGKTATPTDAGKTATPSDAGVIAGPAEASFPGGLDDDGPGPDEYEYYGEEIFDADGGDPYSSGYLTPEEFIKLDANKQYEANIFLSNFAEQGINLYFYDLETSRILPPLVDFAHIWCKINDRSAITYAQFDGGTYEVLTLDKVRSVIKRYISLDMTQESVENYYYPQEHSFYRDGKFYFDAADGEAHNCIAVADSLARLDNGLYCLTFTEYEIDLDRYYSFETGIPRSYYELSASDASQHQYLTRIRDGYAIVTPYQYNGRNTYQLVEYTTY